MDFDSLISPLSKRYFIESGCRGLVLGALVTASCSGPDRPNKGDAETQIFHFLERSQLGLVVQYANVRSGHVVLCGDIGPNVSLINVKYENGYKADDSHYVVAALATYKFIISPISCLQNYLALKRKVSIAESVGRIEPYMDENEAKTRLAPNSYKIGDEGEVHGFQFVFLKTENGFMIQRLL